MSKHLKEELERHIRHAKAVMDLFPDGGMDAETAARVEYHVNQADSLKTQLAVLESGSTIPVEGVGIDDRLGGTPVVKRDHVLSPEQKVADVLGTSRYGVDAIHNCLGVMIKSQVAPVDGREVVDAYRSLGESKDMLSSGGGGNLVPVPVANFLVDLARANMVVSRLGARTVPMSSASLKVPRMVGDVVASWYNEGAVLTGSDASLDSITLTARRIEAGPTKVSLELVEDSDPVAVGQVVANSIAAAVALEVDRVALRGTGTAPEPRGIKNQTGVQSYSVGPTNGGAASFSTLIAMSSLLAQANHSATGAVLHPRTAYNVADVKDSTGQFVAPPAFIAGLWNASQTTTALPTNLVEGTSTNCTELYVGDFRQLLLGIRTSLSLTTLNELYRAEGKVGIVGRARVDVAVEHGNAFVVATDVTN